jgi:uncharacterized repeat protein (TIGR03806 family)
MVRLFVIAVSLLLFTACSAPVTVFQEGDFPEKLSAWGILKSEDGELHLHEDSFAYDLNTPLFTDYAHKLRTLWVPEGQQAEISENRISLPVGSVISKTFYYRLEDSALINVAQQATDFSDAGLNLDRVRLIETRLLVHLDAGWVGLPYVWDHDQKDATLQIAGDLFELSLDDQSFSYAVPDFNQCQGCHIENLQTDAMSPIGLKVRHVNKPYEYLNASDNQIQAMADHGLLRLASSPDTMPRNADYLHPGLSLDARARSYLDINCGHCHKAHGAADTSGLYLDISEQDPIKLGVCKPPIAAGQGTGGHRFNILPGNADESILPFRMRTSELGAMMPELGRSLVHVEGVTLVEDWINSMKGEC